MTVAVDLAQHFLGRVDRWWKAGERHAVLISGNTGDDAAIGSKCGSLADVLSAHLAERFDVVVRYDLADGLRIVHGDERLDQSEDGLGLPVLNALPTDALRLAREMLAGRPERRIALVVGGLDDIAPLTSNAPSVTDRACLEQLERLADDSRIADGEHLILAICADSSPILGRLIQPSSRWVLLELPPPDEAARLDVIEEIISAEDAPILDGVEPRSIARLTRGMSSAELRHELLSRPIVDAREVHQMRRAAVERCAGGLLEAIEPRPGGWAEVPGLDHVRRAFDELVLPDGSFSSFAGDGVLLAGPPGCGKSITPKALAAHRPVLCAALGDVRGMWYGESERNISALFRTGRTFGPLVGFIDEIEGMLGRRPEGPDGTSGVEKRVFARFLAGIEETRREGSVLWVGATNRPDLIDEAMLSRFPRVLPVLLPGPIARARILAAVARSLGADDDAIDWEAVGGRLPNASSRDLEHIVRRAALLTSGRLTEDAVDGVVDAWRPPRSLHEIHRLSLAALEHVRFEMDMPPTADLPEHLTGSTP